MTAAEPVSMLVEAAGGARPARKLAQLARNDVVHGAELGLRAARQDRRRPAVGFISGREERRSLVVTTSQATATGKKGGRR